MTYPPNPPAGGGGRRVLSPLQYALYLLRNRSYSKHIMSTKLRDKKYDVDQVNQTIKKLERIGFIDDKKFAENYAQDKVRIYRRGRHRIYLELLQKGVPKDIIINATNNIGSEQELEAAKSIVKSKQKQWRNLTDQKRYERSFALLQRRGFPMAAIKEVIKR